MTDFRVGVGKIQDEPEYLVPEVKEQLIINQKFKKNEDMLKGHIEPAQRVSHWTSQRQFKHQNK